MSNTKTGIEWTDRTWNPTTGCTKISPGCLRCYAEELTRRFPNGWPNGFDLTLHSDRLTDPLKWRKPSRVFVNSMSDLFHKDVPLEFIQEVFSVIEKTPWHTYQILTKRSDRLKELAPKLIWHENIWMGVSVETQNYVNRIADLVTVPAKIRFLSCEPLLGPLYLPLYGIHWVIVGGESGAGSRDMASRWAISIRDQCYVAGVPFFFKQWGGRTPKAGGCLLEGEEIKEFPEQNLKNKPQQAKLEPTNQPMQLNLF